MRKLIAAINMTLDGFCDHTAIEPDDEIHQHYADLLSNADAILYGRKTFQLMEYWRTVVEHPTGKKSIDGFAVIMDKIPKIVFSNTFKNEDAITNGWKSARLSNQTIEEEVKQLRQSQNNGVILAGSRSMVIQLMKLNLIDEFQLCVHPVIAGKGLPLFEHLHDRKTLKLIKTKIFRSGAVVFYYEPDKI
jgi:dihydrofolate reductase